MNKIEIHDLNELINQKYPINYVQKIINDVLNLSMLVKNDYPDYKQWFLNKQVPGIYDGSRNIIIAHIGTEIVGFASLKKDISERKICTFYVSKNFRKNKIGLILIEKSILWLECEKPLITIPTNKIGGFLRIAKKYNWQVSDIKDGLYRVNNPEIIMNGAIKDTITEVSDQKEKTKSLTKIWFFYVYNEFFNIKKCPFFKKLI